ncbi:hypothetical protein REPUB_Repub14bG0030800 [Reevesia pubescens]
MLRTLGLMEGGMDFSLTLVGKVFSRNFVNVNAMKNVFLQVWKLHHSLHITEIGNKIYMFHFGDGFEKDRVFLSQPWSFNKALLILQEFNHLDRPENLVFEQVPFWIQIHGLPVGMFSEKIGIVLGESIGEVLEVDMDDIRINWGRYLRIRHLPDLCFVCGRLNHRESECDAAYQLKKRTGKICREYGPWMNANQHFILSSLSPIDASTSHTILSLSCPVGEPIPNPGIGVATVTENITETVTGDSLHKLIQL